MTAVQKTEFTGSHGNRLAADIHGEGGQPVILLHGGGQTRHAWRATAKRLASEGFTAIAVDLRGHGESAWVDNGRYSFYDFGDDATAVAQQVHRLSGHAPVGVGASLGGLSLLSAQLRNAPLLESLILVDIVPRMNMDGVQKIRGFMTDRIAEGFASLEEAADAIAAYLPHRKRPKSLEGLRKNLRLGDDGRYRWHWDPALYTGEYSLRAQGGEFMSSLDAGLPEIAIPVLLVRGMNSELVDEKSARDAVGRIPKGRYVDVGGAGHMVAGDRNDAFGDAVVDFLAQTALT